MEKESVIKIYHGGLGSLLTSIQTLFVGM